MSEQTLSIVEIQFEMAVIRGMQNNIMLRQLAREIVPIEEYADIGERIGFLEAQVAGWKRRLGNE